MPSTINLLDPVDALDQIDSDGVAISIDDIGINGLNWDVINGLYTVQSTDFYTSNRYVLNINPSSTGSVQISINEIPLRGEDRGLALSFNARLKVNSVVTVTTILYIDDNQSSEIAEDLVISSGEYTAIHSNVATVPDDANDHTATIVITVSGHGDNQIFLTHPNLIHDLDFYTNPFVGFMRNYFPDFYWELDEQQINPTFPFFKLLDVLSSAAGDSRKMYDRLYGFENEQLLTAEDKLSYWARSVLTTPELAGAYYGTWLSQFTGEGLKKNIQLKDGSFYFDNNGLIHDFIVWQLSNSHFGRAAGSRRAIAEAIRQVLIKTKNNQLSTRSVAITNKYQGNAFRLNIQTLENETIDASATQSSYVVLAAANIARPMGFLITHNTVTAFYFTLDDESLGIIGEFTLL